MYMKDNPLDTKRDPRTTLALFKFLYYEIWTGINQLDSFKCLLFQIVDATGVTFFFRNSYEIHSAQRVFILQSLTLSWRRTLLYRNQSIDLQSKSMDWFLYDNGLHHERVKWTPDYDPENDHPLFCSLKYTHHLITPDIMKQIPVHKGK